MLELENYVLRFFQFQIAKWMFFFRITRDATRPSIFNIWPYDKHAQQLHNVRLPLPGQPWPYDKHAQQLHNVRSPGQPTGT